MPLEIKDPATGKIKTWVFIASGGILLLIMLIVRGSSSSSNNGTVDPTVSAGQSSGITDQLHQLQDAVNNLANNPATGHTPSTGTTGSGGSSTSGGGTGGSGTGGTGTGSGTSGGGTSIGGGGSPVTGDRNTRLSWLNDFLNNLHGGHLVNPTNPASPITFPISTAPYNGALPIPHLSDLFSSGNWLTTHQYLTIQPIGNIPPPTPTVPNAAATLRQVVQGVRTTHVIPSTASLARPVRPVLPNR